MTQELPPRYGRLRITSKLKDTRGKGFEFTTPETRVHAIAEDGTEIELIDVTSITFVQHVGEFPRAIITVATPELDVLVDDGQVIDSHGRKTILSPLPEEFRGNLGEPLPPPEDLRAYAGDVGKVQSSAPPTTVDDRGDFEIPSRVNRFPEWRDPTTPDSLPETEPPAAIVEVDGRPKGDSVDPRRRTDRVGTIGTLAAMSEHLRGKLCEFPHETESGKPASVRGIISSVRRAPGSFVPEVNVLSDTVGSSWVPLAMVKIWDAQQRSFTPPPIGVPSGDDDPS